MYDRQLRKGCPVNGLPTELLAYIFYLGTHDHWNDALLPFPVIASHVCRLWRNVALGSPSLWTTITISTSERPQYKHPQIWIERSKSLPIEIAFEVGWDTDAEIMMPALLSHLSTILDILTPHVTRCRKLEVVVYRQMCMNNVLTWLAQCTSAPRLEILALHCINGSFTPESPLVPFHGNAPRLSYVTLENVTLDWSSSLLHDLVEFESDLSNLEMDVWPNWVDFSRILRESPRLTCLRLFYSGPAESFTDWPDEPIELPSLENLSLMNDDPIYILSLFRLLSMPNLKKLSLDLHMGDYSEFVRHLATPPLSVLSRLRYLKIVDLFCDSDAIDAMCEQLTNLKSIYLSDTSIDKSFFTTLMDCSSGVWYCPNLTTIFTSGIPVQDMKPFITVRANAGIPIKRIVMRNDDVLNEVDEWWLRENVQSFERFSIFDKVDMDVEA